MNTSLILLATAAGLAAQPAFREHTLAIRTGDFDGGMRDEIVVGYRGKARSVALYKWNGDAWTKTLVDNGGIAAAGCAIADVNADGRPDIACIGSTTTNLKWYENLGKSK